METYHFKKKEKICLHVTSNQRHIFWSLLSLLPLTVRKRVLFLLRQSFFVWHNPGCPRTCSSDQTGLNSRRSTCLYLLLCWNLRHAPPLPWCFHRIPDSSPRFGNCVYKNCSLPGNLPSTTETRLPGFYFSAFVNKMMQNYFFNGCGFSSQLWIYEIPYM